MFNSFPLFLLRKILVLLSLLPAAGWAQTSVPVNRERLAFLADSFETVAKIQKAEAIEWARINDRPVRRVTKDGREIEIMRIENGRPVYFITSNDDAALSTNTNDLWNGGSLGLNLEGQNMFLGEWDGGAIRLTHQEFNPAGGGGSRVTQGDSPSSSSWHATHVAGTMMAEGQVASAKGMAPQADLHAYDWNSDNSEMSTEAAGGLLISNHSYGTIVGWRFDTEWYWYGDLGVSTVEDHNFGRYNSDARSWDLIAEAAPYYLICKSAGNDRNDDHNGSHKVWQGGAWVNSSDARDPDGGANGYDCVGPAGTAKNILTVAAVNDVTPGWTQPSDVTMSSFSGWGPTDDGRIKPDISGNGVGLYSCDDDNDADYTSSSGTSMSSPNVAGSLLLLQQHYNNAYGSYMRSSTLKGLVIHTANEAGSNPGPDYAFGWGLLDAAAAADVISTTGSNVIFEPTLSDGNTWSYTFTANGTQDFSATLGWIDPAAATTGSVLNPTAARLINDLDIRLSDGSTTYTPWVLDPANPSNAATNGDNFRDNVEKLEPGILPAGNYTLTVSHKGSLTSGTQPFSLIISGVPSIPIADFSASTTAICPNETVTLNNASSGGATTFAWSISPNTGFSFAGGTSASSSSPQILFTSAGTYSITLVSSNNLGSDTETKTSYLEVGGLTLPFSEDFETTATRDRWTIDNPDGSTTWAFSSVGGNGGSVAASMDNYNYSAANNAEVPDHLISPSLSFSGMTSVTLNFEYAYRRYDSSYQDSLSVWVSTDCGTSWIRLASYEEDGTSNFITGSNITSQWTPSSEGDWCNGTGSPSCPTIDLTPYAGMGSIKIRFTNMSGYGNDLFIDNIQITGSSASSLVVTANKTDLDCNGDLNGSASVTVSGGTSPYTFSWSNGTVEGGAPTTHNISVGNFFFNPSNTTISAGDTILWTNTSGTHNVNGSLATFPSNPEGFTNGSAASGAWTYKKSFSTPGTYNYHCDPHSGSMTGSFVVSPMVLNSSINGLSAGSYSCTITDANGASSVQSFTISSPAALSTTESLTHVSVFGASDGQISVTAAGGTSPIQFDWSNGASSNTNPNIISNLSAGTYSVTLTDANGCIFTDNYTLTEPATTLSVTLTGTNNLCHGTTLGSIATNPAGGTLPYSYAWSTGSNSSSITGLSAGSYFLTLTDGVGSSVTASATLIDPSALLASVSTIDESIAGAADGTASVAASGGTPPYSYLWSNGGLSSGISSLAPGTYSVTVTDANGCSISSSGTVGTGVSVLSATGVTTDVLCHGDASGAIDVSPAGGSTPYSFAWSDGSVTEDRTGLIAGSYSVTVSDGSGQTTSSSFFVFEPLELTSSYLIVDSCLGQVSAFSNGGAIPHTYQWFDINAQTTLTSQTVSLLNQCADAVCYEAVCTVTDANGCVLEMDTIRYDGCGTSLNDCGIRFDLFPNPGKNAFRIASEQNFQRIVCLNNFGVVIQTLKAEGRNEIEVAADTWPSGTYYIRIETIKGSTTKKWVKTN